MKKFFTFTLALCLILTTLCACGSKTGASNSNEDAVTILSNVWSLYAEADMFPALGGDMDNMTDGAPGKFALSNTDGLVYQLYIPADDTGLISDVSSIMHAMNSNTFTGCCIKLNNASDKSKFVTDLKNNISNTQWICGAPEKLLIAGTADNDVIFAFGETSMMDTFKANFEKAYPNGKVECYEDIVLGF